MSDLITYDSLVESQRKEKKDLQAKTQRMKHAIPKGDKKKKKDVTAEIAILLAELDLKHETELEEFERNNLGSASTESASCTALCANEDKSEVPSISNENGQDVEGKTPPKNLIDQKVQVIPQAQEKEAHASQKLSKAQKRRNKKALIEKERQKAIDEEAVMNLSSLRNLESEKIKKKLSERNLAIHEVLSDGDCLYKAVAHQLSILNLPPMTVQTLRQLTSDYMKSHIDDLMPFLTNAETGDVMSEEEYMKYCEDIAINPVWGGHVEVQVLSHICGKSIEVIQADCPSIITGEENYEPKLIISYHRHVYGLGEHYNSIIPAPESENNEEN